MMFDWRTLWRCAGRRPSALVLAGLLVLAFGVQANAQGLLSPSAQTLGAEKLRQLEEDPYVMRWREARMAFDAVFEPSAWDEPLALNLFPDAELKARVRSAKTLESGSRFLSGTLVGGGHFMMLRSTGGILRGEFHSGRAVFTVRSQGPGHVLVQEQDVSSLPGCGHDAMMREVLPSLAPKALATARQPQTRPPLSPRTVADDAESPKPIDVLVLYTQRVEDHEGGPDEVIVTLENEIAKMNQVLENSGLDGRRVRGVFEKVDYEQGDDLSIDLKNLEYTVEDHSRFNREVDYSALDEVFPLIEKHQADLVHLFVRDPDAGAAGACGGAGTYSGGDEYFVQRDCEHSDNVDVCSYNRRRQQMRDNVFAVTAVKCISNYTFPHELGHNLGSYHERGDYNFKEETFEILGPFKNYFFGYQNLDFSEVCQVTVMSTGNECFLQKGNVGNISVPYFSNPDLFFPVPPAWYDSSSFKTDTPMGVPGDERTIDPGGPVNAARAIDEVWHLVAALSEPDADELPGAVSCWPDGLAADALSAKLPPSLVFAPGIGTRRFALSFSGQAECVAATAPRVRTVAYRGFQQSLAPWPAASPFQVSVEPPTDEQRAHRLSFAAKRHWASCSAQSRAAAVVDLVEMVDWEGGVSEQPTDARPAGIALERRSAHAFCESAPAKHLRRLGDFNGDGNADVLLRHADDTWRYHPMDGPRVLGRAASRRLADGWQATIGDFDGDGKDDMLMRHPQGRWRYYPMDGARQLPGKGAAELPGDLAWQVAGVGDFNGDGKDDVLLRRLDGEWEGDTSDNWRYRAMDGLAMLGEGQPVGLAEEHPATSWVAGVGDLNGDGKDDALLRRLDGTWHYYPFHGGADGRSWPIAGYGAVALPNDLAWALAGVADFNGDGKADVLLRHEDGRWRYHRMDGRAVLGGGSGDLPADATVWLAGVGDMDGDGRAEVLTRHGHDAWSYYAVDGNGAFAYGGEAELPTDSAWGVLKGGVAAPPRASAAIGDQPLATGTDTELDLSEHFTDDETLAFEVESSDAEVVRASVAGGVLTLTAVADGRATVTVTALDADGHAVRQTFLVVVTEGGVAGRRFRDCDECPEMVVVPAGSFMMGAPEEEEGSYLTERPVHQVDFAAPFAIGVHEVTFAEWDACVAAGSCDGYEPAVFHEGPARTNRPVTEVNWDDAQRYVAWLSTHTGETYRLPSEAEWEYAARAGTQTPFHFGETISTAQANYDGTVAYGEGSVGEFRGDTLPVGSFPANAWGLHDVHGNVGEWTQDCFDWTPGTYDGAPTDGSAWEEGNCDERVARGGNFATPPDWVRSAVRITSWSISERIQQVGIRVVRELED